MSSITSPPLTNPQNTWTFPVPPYSPRPQSFLLNNAWHALWIFDWDGSPGVYTYTVSPYGWGGTDTPPVQYPDYGVRYNLELLMPDDPYWPETAVWNNLQTFLVVAGSGQGTLELVETDPQKTGAPKQVLSLSHPDRDLIPGSKSWQPVLDLFEKLRKAGNNK